MKKSKSFEALFFVAVIDDELIGCKRSIGVVSDTNESNGSKATEGDADVAVVVGQMEG